MGSMTGNIMGRSKQDVKEFVLGLIQSSISKTDLSGEEYKSLYVLRECIRDDVMLSKGQAKILESILYDRLVDNLGSTERYIGSSLILRIDELSIYPDAWGIYCRPGTYAI